MRCVDDVSGNEWKCVSDGAANSHWEYIKMLNIRDPYYPNKHGTVNSYDHNYICVKCNIEGIDNDIIFTSNLKDVEEYGVQVFQNAKNGIYGTVIDEGH